MPYGSNPKVTLVDEDGTPLKVNSSTDKLQVEVDGDITIDNATVEVNLDHDNDSVSAYGYSVENNSLHPIKVHTDGAIEIRGANSFDSEEVTLGDAGTVSTLNTMANVRTIDIMSDPANTGDVYIGGASLSSTNVTGVRLYPGDVYSIDVDNRNLVKAYGTVNAQKISVNWFKYA